VVSPSYHAQPVQVISLPDALARALPPPPFYLCHSVVVVPPRVR
jgi:hypothetical protein